MPCVKLSVPVFQIRFEKNEPLLRGQPAQMVRFKIVGHRREVLELPVDWVNAVPNTVTRVVGLACSSSAK